MEDSSITVPSHQGSQPGANDKDEHQPPQVAQLERGQLDYIKDSPEQETKQHEPDHDGEPDE